MLGLRLTHEEKVALDMTARQYFVSRVGSGTSGGGRDNIVRADGALMYRVAKRQALALRVVGTRRVAAFAGGETNRQTQVTVGLFYTLLGQDLFGIADWL